MFNQTNPVKFRVTLVWFLIVSLIILPGTLISVPKETLASESFQLSKAVATGSPPLSAGFAHTLALDTNNNVWAWGDNSEGQLGTGDQDQRNSPTQVKNLSNVLAISGGGAHSLALKEDGSIWAWGNNEAGQLGIGTNDIRVTTPVQVLGINNTIAISAGMDFSLALTSDGRIYGWGNNEYDQLGSRRTSQHYTSPILIDDISGVKKISAGSAWSLALKTDGTVWTWGAQKVIDFASQIPIGDIVENPTQVNNLSDITDISAGFNHSLALKNDGTVWGWGNNNLAQLGNHSEPYLEAAVQLTDGTFVDGIPQNDVTTMISSIAAGTYLSVLLTRDGTVWVMGANIYGQIGDEYNTPQTKPIYAHVWRVQSPIAVTAIATGGGFVVIRESGGIVTTWGLNSNGQLGQNSIGGPISSGDPNLPANFSGSNIPTTIQLKLGSRIESYKRLAGNEAEDTAVEISKTGWINGSNTVILATVANFPDALAGATLAHQFDAPILLTKTVQLSPSVTQELERLKPSKIIILGGTAVVSGNIENQLKAKYSDVTRLAGWDQYETSAQIAKYFYSVNPNAPKKAVIAYGENFPDALSVSSWAAYNQIPILLTRKDVIPKATLDAISQMNIQDGFLVGGKAVISQQVQDQMSQLMPKYQDKSKFPNGIPRYWGMNQYQTGIEIAKGLGIDMSTVFIANGTNYPDALTASALAARTGSPIILVDKNRKEVTTNNFLFNNSGKIKQAYFIGGTSVIPFESYYFITRFLG